MAFVADASITAAWFLPSQANAYTDAALARLASEPARVPCLWPDRKSTRLNSSHIQKSRMPSSA